LTDLRLVFGQSSPYNSGWKTYVMNLNQTNECSTGYLKALSEPLKKGMVLAFTNWGDSHTDMSWLDGETKCQAKCGWDQRYTIGDIQVNNSQPIEITKTEIE
jgi:hypothetical protein